MNQTTMDTASDTASAAKPRKYLTIDCRVLEVMEDWILPGTYLTFWKTVEGALHRVRSKDLPDRKTPEEAQRDLDAYAEKNHFPEVEE